MPWRRLPSFLLIFLLALPVALYAQDDPVEARLRADITYLASDECEGRGVGTKGIDLAASYISQQFVKAGLVPGGVKGTWFQPFTMTKGAPKLLHAGLVTLKGPLGQTITLRASTDFQVMALSGNGTVSGPLVFAGHGVTAKEIGYDDYQGIDVAGKIVIVLRKTPRFHSEAGFDGARKDEHATFDRKQAVAEIHRAAAVIHVNDLSEAANGDKLLDFTPQMGLSPSGIPAVQMRRTLVDTLLQSSLGVTLREVEQSLSRDLKPRSAALSGWTATIETRVSRDTIAVKNVIGVLEGSGPLANETIVVGAHYDHLGFGGAGSLSPNRNKGVKEIHHGADDNGSGTTSVIELARRFGAIKNRQGRRIVFMTFSAEESGLLGSAFYCNKQPMFALADTAAMVNLDMVGRMRPDKGTNKERLIVEGVGTAKGFEQLVDKLNPGFTYTKRPGSPPYSDNDSFYRKRIPVLFFWTDTHEDYHRPSDTADKINIAGMRKIIDLAEKVITELATDSRRPEYVQVASSMKSILGGGGPKGPKLGIVPQYDEAVQGVGVGGLVDGGAAGKAGIKPGDVVVQIAGRPVNNINTYMAIMAQQKSGQSIEVVVLRKDQKVTLKVLLP